ncbi:MAG: adenosylcobinamide-phosphate synthase CbiB [Proteobacteria bacterium]|nr:adenosylcobinamide-phosphate synthase CbiB [Pseudomonadota bacterium]
MTYLLQLLSAVVLDLFIGDPAWLPHPVRGIGRLCIWSEKFTRSLFTNLYLAGLVTVFFVLTATGTIVFLLLQGATAISPMFGAAFAVFLLYTTIATRDLLRHSNAVHAQLQPNCSLAKAREAIAMIVGRDTQNLSQAGITCACIETVAENMVDGVTAPLFFAVIASFAAPMVGMSPISCSVMGAIVYKAVNTMDSMIGYKNEKYMQFGKCAAKLDDAVNFLPSRISGLCVILAAFFLKLDYREAARIFRRDRLNHSSPNAGHTEAAAAGALGLRLGGPSFYFGKIVEKPYLGDDVRQPVPDDIKKTNNLMLVGTSIFVVFLIGLRFMFA